MVKWARTHSHTHSSLIFLAGWHGLAQGGSHGVLTPSLLSRSPGGRSLQCRLVIWVGIRVGGHMGSAQIVSRVMFLCWAPISSHARLEVFKLN